MELSDIELMLRVRDGHDAAAFEDLMRRYQRPVIAFLIRLTGSGHVAQDLAEETFVRVWQSAPRYRPSAKFTTWLFTIASRLATDHHRRADTRRAVPFDPILADTAPTAGAEMVRAETAARVRDAVQALPPQQRAALVLCEFEGLSHAEAAEALGCTVKSIEMRLYRAKETLRMKLRPVMNDG